MSSTSMVLFKAGETPGSFSSSFLVFSIVASTSIVSIFIRFLNISHLNEDIITQVFEEDFFERGGLSAYFKILDMTCYTPLAQKVSIKRITFENPLNKRRSKSIPKIKFFAKTLVK
jgi:hypothetical protein